MRWDSHTPEMPGQLLDRYSIPITECGCHAWLGKLGTGGYAYVRYRNGAMGKRITRKAATVAWELHNSAERPAGKELHHVCHSRWCVNPEHLILTTRSENSSQRRPYRRKIRKSKEERLAYLAEWRARNRQYAKEYAQANKDHINAQRRERRKV